LLPAIQKNVVNVAASATSFPNFASDDALVTAVVQDVDSGDVLMVAHMNRAAWDQTVATGEAVYFSRSRGRLWKKGEESGNVQQVREIFVDCDADAVLLKVEQLGGAACHKGYESCFYRRYADGNWQVTGQRVFDPDVVYKKKD
jgi:phosphoribosyl-AMP cyclohydrolase